MKRYILCALAALSVSAVAWAANAAAAPSVLVLSVPEMEQFLGGACEDKGCITQTCDPTAGSACPGKTETVFCVPVEKSTKCIRQSLSTITGCGKRTGFQNCKETTQ